MQQLLGTTASRALERLPESAPKDMFTSVHTMLAATAVDSSSHSQGGTPRRENSTLRREALQDARPVLTKVDKHVTQVPVAEQALVPSLDLDSLLTSDHVHVLEFEISRHSNGCRHVTSVTGEDEVSGESASAASKTVDYAGFYVQRGKAQAADAPWQAKPRRWHRLDGQSNVGSAHKFSLMDSGALLVRLEGQDPFHSHALVSSTRPVAIFQDGHYFEVRVKSLFHSEGRPERPKQLEPRHRSEGIVIGVTATSPSDIGTHVRSTREVPRSWAVTSGGRFYSSASSDPDVGRVSRPVSPERVRQPQTWHQKPVSTEQLRCAWPVPTSPLSARSSMTKNIGWSKAISDGDTIGFLVTPFGGAVLYVNGVKELLIPDARISADTALYPLLEVYNHIRSVELLTGAAPPK